MKLIRLLICATLLMFTMACNEDEPVNPFRNLERNLKFEKSRTTMRLNGEAFSPQVISLTLDTLESGETTSCGNIYISMDATFHQVHLPVQLELLKANEYNVYKYRIFGESAINNIDNIEQYKIEGIITVMPNLNQKVYGLSIDVDYELSSQFSDRTYYIDFKESPFVMLNYAPSTIIDGIKVDNIEVQEKSEKLINDDLKRKGSKLKLEFGSDGLLTVFRCQDVDNDYIKVHSVRYWIDESDGNFVTSLTGSLIDEFEDIWLVDADQSKPAQFISGVDFYSSFRFRIIGNPSISESLFIMPTGWGQGPIIKEMARFRANSDKWTPEEIKCMENFGNIISRELNGFSSHFLWGMKINFQN